MLPTFMNRIASATASAMSSPPRADASSKVIGAQMMDGNGIDTLRVNVLETFA